MTTPTVLVVGGVGVDHIVHVPSIPPPFADSTLVPPIQTFVGHTGNGVALGLHALGVPTTFVDVIGEDIEGERIQRHYADHGLTAWFSTHPSGTRRSVNLVGDDGRRMSFYDPRHPFEFCPPEGLWREQLPQVGHVHASIMNWARHALADAVDAGLSTSTDLHDWDGANEYHRDFALGADIVFCSASALTNPQETVDDIMGNGRAHTVVIMDGANGSRVTTREGQWQIPALRVPGREIVDSNGAGDSYVAAYLAAILTGSSPEQAGRHGAWAGAWACGTAGTHTSFITADDIAGLEG